MGRVRTRVERDDRAFTAPGGNPEGIVSAADCVTAGIHTEDGTAWSSAKFQGIRVGDLMDLGGFLEKTPPRRKGTRELDKDEMATVVNALEIHTGMNYYGSGHGAAGGEYACAACCTCI